jgi:methyl-accepting chemotaxis protein
VIGRIESISGAISHSVEVQRIASQRIAESVSGSADRTKQVSSTIEGVSGFAEKTREGAERIMAAVAQLNRQAGTLQQDAEQFANRVRAA